MIVWLSLFFNCITFAASSLAQDKYNIVYITAQDTVPYQLFSEALHARLRNYSQINLIKFSENPAEAVKPDLLIVAGQVQNKIIDTLIQTTPTVYALISKQSYLQTITHVKPDAQHSAVFIEQPYTRQLAAIKHSFPKVSNIGILYSENSELEVAEISAATKQYQITLTPRLIQDAANIFPAIISLASQTQALFAIPDPMIFNRNTAQNILLTSYKSRIPLIAYSQSYVKAGALFAVFSTPSQYAAQISEISAEYLLQKKPLNRQGEFPKYFSVQANYAVARSLGIEIPDLYPDNPE